MSETQSSRRQRKSRTGVVTSDKMEMTVTVSLSRRLPHPVYSKIVSRTSTVKARDEKGARIGDTVRVMETRPISKTVRWRVIDIVTRAK